MARTATASPDLIEDLPGDTPALPADLAAAMLAAIQDLSGKFETVTTKLSVLESDLAQVKGRSASFMPMAAPDRPQRPILASGPLQKGPVESFGEASNGQSGPPLDQRGAPLWPDQLRHDMPRFREGSPVRIVRSATRPGLDTVRVEWKENTDANGKTWKERIEHKTPKTWGEVLDPLGGFRCQAKIEPYKTPCGTVVTVGEACERCGNGPRVQYSPRRTKYDGWKFKVIVPGLTKSNFGDGFYDWELEPA